VLSAVRDEGYTVPTPIQVEAIPAIIAGRDLLGIAQTGTGKTAAFALPIIQRLFQNPIKRMPRTTRVLVVAPTRELAAQIDQSFSVYGKGASLLRACVFGGVGSVPQERSLSHGVDVLTATPGRLLDLIDRNHLLLSSVETVVLDEADRMFDMGFIRDVRRIVALLPKKRQTVLFSATMPPEIEAFADPILTDPVRAAVPSTQPTADRVDQKVLFVGKEDKRKLLAAILKEDGFERVIVFTKTKHGANRLVKQLEAEGIVADAIHANKSQNQRTRAMDGFRSGSVAVLVATDLAARGIDVDDIELVVNFDLPNEPETYIHRIGRTARAGNEGVAVSFCDADERILLRDIERLIGFRIPVELDHPFRLEIEPLRETESARRPKQNQGRPRPPMARQGPDGGGRGRPNNDRPANTGRGSDGPRREAPTGAFRPGNPGRGPYQGSRPNDGGRPMGGPRGPGANRGDNFRRDRGGSPPRDFGGEPSIASMFAGSSPSGVSAPQNRSRGPFGEQRPNEAGRGSPDGARPGNRGRNRSRGRKRGPGDGPFSPGGNN
jgi:ATP-dependent RNA helicase RhlE